MIILVCGGRNFSDSKLMCEWLDPYLPTVTQIIHGGATGADSFAGWWANKHAVPCRVFPADWSRYQYKAGPIRNQQMLEEGKPDLVIAFPGGRGTADMVYKARYQGFHTIDLRAVDDGLIERFNEPPEIPYLNPGLRGF